jgi:hypothetical protein
MYIDINTLFTFEVSKSDDQSILAAIVHRITDAKIQNLSCVNIAFLIKVMYA